MHLVYPPEPPPSPTPKFCITIVFDFSWDDCNAQEELENNGYAKFWGVSKALYGPCENGELTKNSALEGLLNITYNEVSKKDPFGIK